MQMITRPDPHSSRPRYVRSLAKMHPLRGLRVGGSVLVTTASGGTSAFDRLVAASRLTGAGPGH
jgi:hypothetical protein